MRVAFEVADADATTTALLDVGAELIAPPTLTPWDSLNSRLHGPGDMQLTIFHELQPADPSAETHGQARHAESTE